ncbi:MAG: hypothetical protein V9H69_02115 [Anaerolineae bacterium]
MVAEAGAELVPFHFLHEAALGGVPDGLVDLAQVGLVGQVRVVAADGDG